MLMSSPEINVLARRYKSDHKAMLDESIEQSPQSQVIEQLGFNPAVVIATLDMKLDALIKRNSEQAVKIAKLEVLIDKLTNGTTIELEPVIEPLIEPVVETKVIEPKVIEPVSTKSDNMSLADMAKLASNTKHDNRTHYDKDVNPIIDNDAIGSLLGKSETVHQKRNKVDCSKSKQGVKAEQGSKVKQATKVEQDSKPKQTPLSPKSKQTKSKQDSPKQKRNKIIIEIVKPLRIASVPMRDIVTTLSKQGIEITLASLFRLLKKHSI